MISITYDNKLKNIEIDGRKSILELVRENFECSFSPCPKSYTHDGTCGRCLVRVKKDAKSEWELVKACHSAASDGMQVVCCFDGALDDRISTLPGESTDLNCTEYCAVDLGSTTIAAKSDDNIFTMLNPQRIYGSDVISRISASCDGNGDRLMSLVRDAIGRLLDKADPMREYTSVIAGNTTMIHLLMGYECEGLGAFPFTAHSLAGEDLVMDGRRIITVPHISSFIGGDIVSGLYYIEETGKDTDTYLFIDLGTNAEMVLKHNGVYYCAASSAGPAFESSVSIGLPGADMLHILADALKKGVIDETGLLADEYFDDGYELTYEGRKVTLTQQTIRELQLAKAAIYCAAGQLMKRAGVGAEDISKVCLAGGFGYCLRQEDAFVTGLLDGGFAGKVEAVGNSSLKGAALLSSAVNRGEAEAEKELMKLTAITDNAQVVTLSLIDSFAKDYLDAMNFPGDNMIL